MSNYPSGPGYPPPGGGYPPPGGGYPPPGGGYPPPGGGYPPPPGPMGHSPGGFTPPPPNHLVWAILTTFFCCLPLGVVSIVFAAQVNSKWHLGDYAGAMDSSTKARQFAIWSAVVTVVGIALYLFAAVAGLVSIARLS